MNPKAQILLCKSTLSAVVPMQGSQTREEQAQRMDLRGKTALVIEDGPTLTHGGMAYGAGYVLAMQEGAFPDMSQCTRLFGSCSLVHVFH